MHKSLIYKTNLIVNALMFFSICMVNAQECDEQEDCCVCESSGPAHHVHFSSEEIDIYDQTPDTLYKDADWPSRVEEYSDYLSR
jgi:hypothetical protein